MYLLDEQGGRREGKLPIIETKLTVLVASDREELALLRQNERVRAATRDLLYQYIEAETFGSVHVPVPVMLRWVLAVAKLAIVVATLREVLSVPVDYFCVFAVAFSLIFDSLREVVFVWVPAEIVGVREGVIRIVATILIVHLKWGRSRVLRHVLEASTRGRSCTVSVSSDQRLANARRYALSPVVGWQLFEAVLVVAA